MDLNLKSNFSKQIAYYLIGKLIKTKLGCEFDICLNDIVMTTDEAGLTTVHPDVTAKAERSQIRKLIKDYF